MKKIFYIILIAILLLVAGHFANQYFASEPEIVVVEEEIAIPAEETTSETTTETDIEAETESEDVVETNPEETSDEGETFVEE
ncbi:MAG: hypothetical protein E7012_06785 [Alphaproteobacteria bacterium]|nr:hypothetical protein [Alphaproteobacteria bacterium]